MTHSHTPGPWKEERLRNLCKGDMGSIFFDAHAQMVQYANEARNLVAKAEEK